MSEIYRNLIRFFEQQGREITCNEERETIMSRVTGENGWWVFLVEVLQNPSRVVCSSILPVNVPEERRPAMSEFLARMNYGLLAPGAGQMDFDDGEIRFSTCLCLPAGGEFSESLFRPIIFANLAITDHYFPGIAEVVAGTASAAAAVQRVEACLAGRKSKETGPFSRPSLSSESFN